MKEKSEKLMEVQSFSKAVFDGFVLKRGYFYGRDDDGRPIATSTFVKDGKLALYTKDNSHWIRSWIPLETARNLYPNLNLDADK